MYILIAIAIINLSLLTFAYAEGPHKEKYKKEKYYQEQNYRESDYSESNMKEQEYNYEERQKVTPYGDYCKDCSTYGKCRDVMTPQKSENAINQYYNKKGYKVQNVNHKGRFIEADIYNKKDKKVDKVLFDRKTGRLRSVY